ncbi:MAG: excinuclease ABC subunit UvrA [Verrucomicrobiota bacterium]
MPRSPRKPAAKKTSKREAIRLQGVTQNNLQGIDCEIPLGQMTVVTGPSGSGKSSLAFQTVYAEGQRRYVETFSPYVRQFFDRMDKPQAERIEGIPPAIAVEQTNNVRTTRSTVGTITEVNDHLKLLFPKVATCHCPGCGQQVQPETAASILAWALAEKSGRELLVCFGVPVGEQAEPRAFFEFLQAQGYLRVRIYEEIYRTDQPEAFERPALPAVVTVVQDRIKVDGRRKTRLLEAIEASLHFGKGRVQLIDRENGQTRSFSKHWHCADCDRPFPEPTPGLFSFNHPLGACPDCRGFGRVIGIDLDKALPDPTLSIRQGVVKAFSGTQYAESKGDLMRAARKASIDLDTPFEDLSPGEQEWVIEGDRGDAEQAWQNGEWYGVRGFFDWLESKAYKMHVRVFLSRFRSYTLCRSCQGARLRPAALDFRVGGRTLPEWWTLSVSELRPFVERAVPASQDPGTEMIRGEILARLGYLEEVGLGYLSLDRPTRTLSGGEVARVNLTTCLGAALTDTLFVLDEPSIGLHPRDTRRLVRILHALRDRGNTLLVVEHEEAIIRAADHLLDIGPGSGSKGGQLIYAGRPRAPRTAKGSLTLDHLSGRKVIAPPTTRRAPSGWLEVKGASSHNLNKLDARIPLGVFACVTGVSGSGKSTLIHQIFYQNLRRHFGEPTEEEPGRCQALLGLEQIRQVVLVDQSVLAKTPRSTPALYLGLFDAIRNLFAAEPEAQRVGIKPGYFSFNSGEGRCQRCLGNGFEKVEMQFLSDLFLRCPECEGRRFQKEALEFTLQGRSIADVLEMTASQARAFFEQAESGKARDRQRIAKTLALLEELGLDYLSLGQSLNTLSGGESQRLKLAAHLLERTERADTPGQTDLLLFDEPTTGLHFDDVAKLLRVFHRLVEEGCSLWVIEHNLDVIRSADHLIDLGPEAGSKGGRVIAEGTPEEVAQVAESHTGQFLRGDREPARSEPSTVSKKTGTQAIEIRGARHHNLKNLSLDIPKNEFVLVTGLSGSGKSTLAFDIVFAEGQRRFLDSMSPYARQFAEQLEKPEVDRVSGLPPTVAIEQRVSQGGGKSTVATVTEVYHFLRLLFAKVGVQHCPNCWLPVEPQSSESIAKQLRPLLAGKGGTLLAPVVRGRKGFHTEVAEWALRSGFPELLVNRQFQMAEDFQRLDRYREHEIDVVVARLTGKETLRELRQLVERALQIGKGTLRFLDARKHFRLFSDRRSCTRCGRAFDELDPRLFSFNSPHGWCPTCRGFGTIRKSRWEPSAKAGETALDLELQEEERRESGEEDSLIPCPQCEGKRIHEEARAVRVQKWSISDLTQLSVREARQETEGLRFRGRDKEILRDILPEIGQRLRFLEEVGLGYLSLDRGARTLSGGEAQRIRLASQLGSNLRGVLYVLDEPTIGLHPRDNETLLHTLEALRRKGNSLLVVEHDEDTLRRADRVLDLGPGAGRLGGELVAKGTLAQIRRSQSSPTGRALRTLPPHPYRGARRPLPAINAKEGWLRVYGAHANNLRHIDVRLPLGRLSVITGVSGSGKSSFLRGVLQPAAKWSLGKPSARRAIEKTWAKLKGFEKLAAVYEVDQSPLGKTSRSTPATYIKVFDEIRKLYAQIPEARMRGYEAARFSFNTEGGRCETCKGQGRIKLEMAFLPTTYTLCERCQGRRYNAATEEILWQDRSIGQVLDATIEEAAALFAAHPKIALPLQLLAETGTGYLQLGQPSPTLSGGEAQRLKLVAELAKGAATRRKRGELRDGKGNLYLIEEPSIGLHLEDVRRLIDVLHRLVDEGHTVVVIEHDLSVMAEADYLVDIGPEPGQAGGEVVAQGTPEKVAQVAASRTAPFLRRVLYQAAELAGRMAE